VIGVPKIMHDAGLTMPMVVVMVAIVDLHGRDAVVGD
jgi:hypothetical protein